MKERELSIRQAVCRIVNAQSEAGTLVSPEEIQVLLLREGLLSPESESHEFTDILEELTREENNIQKILDRDGKPHYYSARHLDKAYALILVQRKDNALELIADTVRENSRIYPRPVPLVLFVGPPFSMSLDEIEAYRMKMTESKEHSDIVSTATSAGTIFLYSTLYLSPSYAEYLAEWLDVGQFENP